MAQLLIDQKLAQEILDYLQKQPYVEVYALIQGMAAMKLSPFEVTTEPTKEDEPKKDGKDANVPTKEDRQIPE